MADVKYYIDDTKQVIKEDLFAVEAKKYADSFSNDFPKIKSSQMRKFYNDILLIKTKIEQAPKPTIEFQKQHPYINMIVAKAAYAKARRHIGDNFERFLKDNIADTIKDDRDFMVFCDLFEAVVAYYGNIK